MPAREHGNGSGTTIGYVVEARTTAGKPQQIGKIILDAEWRQVPFDRVPDGLGVRAGLGWCPQAQDRGLMDYAGATSLACWFAADAGWCTEIRLVKVQFEYQFTTKEIGVGPAMSLLDLERKTEWSTR